VNPYFTQPMVGGALGLLALAASVATPASLRVGRPAPDAADGAEAEVGAAQPLTLAEEGDQDQRFEALLRPLRELVQGSPAEWRREDFPLTHLAQESRPNQGCGGQRCGDTAPPPVSSGFGRTYVFVMGVEGAGHHAVCPLLARLLKAGGRDVKVAPINMFGRGSILPFQTWRTKFMAEMRLWCPYGVCLNCLDSFPYERPIEASASPDFARMVALHEQGDIDLRVVSIMRNISDAVFSALYRFPSDPVQAVASTRHFFMEVVRNTASWSQRHCERLHTLRYEHLVNGADKVIPGLVRALGLSRGRISRSTSNVEPWAEMVGNTYDRNIVTTSHRYRDKDPELYDKVSSWIGERESFLWPEVNELWCQ